MKEDVYEKLFELLKDKSLELPYGLTLQKISDRGSNFRETDDGKIKFEMERHPTPFGGPTGGKSVGSPARWHESTVYTYDPKSQGWEAMIKDAKFHYDPWLIVEEEMDSLKEGGIIQDIIRKEDRDKREEMINKAINNVIRYYNEQREIMVYEISDEKWEEILQVLEERLKPRLKKEIATLKGAD